MSSIEEKFNAAVNVIKNLPKNGSYQPSSAMMLTFYSYFKQATQGTCKQKKPPFWDVVGKCRRTESAALYKLHNKTNIALAKWDAWNALGEMRKERAMQCYVDELKKIIETMSFTDNVANFVGSINELDNVSLDDLEVVAPEIIKKARSNPDSPFNSRGNSPLHGTSANGLTNGQIDDNTDVYLLQNGHVSGVDQSDDEYIDTVEDNSEVHLRTKRNSHLHTNNNITSGRSESSYEITREHLNYPPANQVVLQQILLSVQRMTADINTVNARMNTLEQLIADLRSARSQTNQKLNRPYRKFPHWWPFSDISPNWFAFLILWPFVAQQLARILQRKK